MRKQEQVGYAFLTGFLLIPLSSFCGLRIEESLGHRNMTTWSVRDSSTQPTACLHELLARIKQEVKGHCSDRTWDSVCDQWAANTIPEKDAERNFVLVFDKHGEMGMLLLSNGVQHLWGDNSFKLRDEANRTWNWLFPLVLPNARRHHSHARDFLQSHPQYDNSKATKLHHGQGSDVGNYGPNTPQGQKDAKIFYRKEWCKSTCPMEDTGDSAYGWIQFESYRYGVSGVTQKMAIDLMKISAVQSTKPIELTLRKLWKIFTSRPSAGTEISFRIIRAVPIAGHKDIKIAGTTNLT